MNARLSTSPFCRLYESQVCAGFPSPADDYEECALDLNAYLIRNRAATFFVRVSGDSMTGAGIFSGDMLVVDRSVVAGSGDIVIVVYGGEFLIRRLFFQKSRVELHSENSDYGVILLGEEDEVEIWGVVKHVIRSL